MKAFKVPQLDNIREHKKRGSFMGMSTIQELYNAYQTNLDVNP
jgi:hypothetical protein